MDHQCRSPLASFLLRGGDSDRHRESGCTGTASNGFDDRAVAIAPADGVDVEQSHRGLRDRLLDGRRDNAVAAGLLRWSASNAAAGAFSREAAGDNRSEIGREFSAEENSHHLLARLPLNEILRLDVTDWTLDVPRLAPALDGLSIVHLSDFHFTGRVGKAFFREVVRTSNELQPDLVALTGDLVDRRRASTGFPTRWAGSPRGTASISFSATTTC